MKKSTQYTPWRNFLALKRRLTKTEQRLILTQGDILKLMRRIRVLENIEKGRI